MAVSERGPRERMVFSAAQLIRRGGVSAAGMRDVAAHAGAPRGSLQHYFPGGKEQLVNEAVGWAYRYASRRVARFLAALPTPTPSGLFAEMVRQWTDEYETSGFVERLSGRRRHGGLCGEHRLHPTGRVRRLRPVARLGGGGPGRHGRTPERAPSLATLMLGSLEGAILLARAERDVRPLTTVSRELAPLLDAAATRGAPDA